MPEEWYFMYQIQHGKDEESRHDMQEKELLLKLKYLYGLHGEHLIG